jgi:hypothetical protein
MMVAKKKASARKTKTKARARKTNPATVMKDLHAVLDKHGIAAKIESMAFTGGQPPCVCPNGRPGVWRVISGRLVCDCS